MRRLSLCLAMLVVCGCTTGTKEKIMRPALRGADGRAEYFEATLRVLDDHPDYVDEFFQQARRHPATLERFIKNAAEHLHEEKLAAMTAKHLAANPASLRRILVETLEAAEHNPRARAAIAQAINDRNAIATDILTDDPDVVFRSLIATVRHVTKKPKARGAFIRAMHVTSPTLADLLVANPKLMDRMLDALVAEAREDPAIVKRLIRERMHD